MIDPLSSDTKIGIPFMYPNYFQAFLMKTPSFWWKCLLCWKEGVFGYIRGVSIMMKGVSPMNGENSVGVPFDSWNVSHW